MSRKAIALTLGLALAITVIGVACAKSRADVSPNPTPSASNDAFAEDGNNAYSPKIVYPPQWMAGNCKVWGGGAVEITSPAAAARGGRVFEKDGEILYSLPKGQCVTLIGAATPVPDWVPESLENLPTPRPDIRPTIQIDPSNLPAALKGVGQ